MVKSIRECYGFRVDCSAHPAAMPVVERFFGPEIGEAAGDLCERGSVVVLSIDVNESTAPVVDPPHTLEVIASTPIVIDAGSSSAVIDPGNGNAHVSLAWKDLDDQIVWGRIILERLFLYCVCRSPRHYPLHAGGIVAEGEAVLLSAPTGVGKSTFSYWCFKLGAGLAGEDIMVRHMDGTPGRVWGYPRAVYLAPWLIAGSPELDPALITHMPDKGKARVQVPYLLSDRIASAADPQHLVFLDRGEPSIRPLSVDEAVERSRDDFATGKSDASLIEALEHDLRALLAGASVWELTVSDDLDASYAVLASMLRKQRSHAMSHLVPETVGE